MANVVRVRSITSGFQWGAYIDCPTNSDGAVPELADTIKGGFAFTQKEAKQKALEAIQNR